MQITEENTKRVERVIMSPPKSMDRPSELYFLVTSVMYPKVH